MMSSFVSCNSVLYSNCSQKQNSEPKTVTISNKSTMGERLRTFTVVGGLEDDTNIVYSPSNGLISHLLMTAIRAVGGEYSANPNRFGLLYKKKWLREDKTLSFYGISNSDDIELKLARKLRVFKVKILNGAQRSSLVDITLSARELCHDFCIKIGYKPSYEYGLQVEKGIHAKYAY